MAVNINSVTLSDATGYLTKFGSYIQKKSKVRVKVNATSTNGTIGIYDYRITINGSTYYANDITTDVLKSSGTNSIIIQVFDNKGATASTTRTINVTAYDTPVINVANVVRCNADGTANKSGSYARVDIDAVCTSLSGNTYSHRIKYKKKSATTYTSVDFTGKTATINESKIISDIDVNSSYDFLIEAQDYFSLSTKIKSLSSKYSIMSILRRGLGVAFGKKAEYEDTLEVGYRNTILSKNVYMGGQNTSDEEKDIFFNTKSDATYQHNSYIYGGDGTNPTAIGIYDGKNGLRVFSYDDTTKELFSGATKFYIGSKKILTAEDIDKDFATVNENGVASTLLVMDIKYDYLDVYCTDSGWQTLSLGSDFSAYSTTTVPKYRKVGKVVEVCGVLKPTATITGSTTQYTIGTLPAGFRPTNSQVTIVCQGSGQAVWTLTIPTTGVMTFSRYRSGATLTDATTDCVVAIPSNIYSLGGELMATYNIKITDDRQVKIPRGISWGCMKENKVTTILFELPETINGTPADEFNKSIDFECVASGYKFSKELNNCECEICENTTNFKNLKAQVVLTKLVDEETNEHIVWKSGLYSTLVLIESINATEKIKIII